MMMDSQWVYLCDVCKEIYEGSGIVGIPCVAVDGASCSGCGSSDYELVVKVSPEALEKVVKSL